MPPPCPSARDAALSVLRRLRSHGHTAYLAGGCVRDALLGLTPKDYDVATDATPDRVQSLFSQTAAVGAAFGVVLVYVPRPGRGRHTIEVATFRAEGAYTDGRRPDAVRFTTAEEDAKRRDFTINGLFADPPPEDAPADTPDTIIDFVGGQADLAAGVLRAIGEPVERFGEDYLRMLRAVRFAARFGFQIEPRTAEAIKEHAPKLDQIARERIGDEVRRMLMMPPPAPTAAAEALQQLGLTRVVLGVAGGAGAGALLSRLDAAADYPTRLLAWFAALDEPVPDKQAARARAALMLSNDEADAAKATFRLWQDLTTLWEPSPTAQRKRRASHPRFDQALMLLQAQAPGDAARLRQEVEALAGDGIGLAPDPLVTGDDLIAMGLKPGPDFKTILDQTYDAQLEGRVTTKQEALGYARDHAS
jgi:tRNA nucleotidyltransferase/poly(A) polymerase